MELCHYYPFIKKCVAIIIQTAAIIIKIFIFKPFFHPSAIIGNAKIPKKVITNIDKPIYCV